MSNKEIIKELNVEKINIVESDGKVKMTLFNSKNIPSMIIEEEDILPGHRSDDGVSGVMFYNNEGDECGGLIYGSNKDENGNHEMGMTLTFDQYKQDQVLQLLLTEQNGIQNYGLSIFDRPKKHMRETLKDLEEIKNAKDEIAREQAYVNAMRGNHLRLFTGKDSKGIVKTAMYDSEGKERIRMYIDENDIPHLEFLDQKGNIVTSLP